MKRMLIALCLLAFVSTAQAGDAPKKRLLLITESKGFVRNSSQPASIPLKRSRRSDCAVTITTGMNRVTLSPLSLRQRSNP